MVQQKNKRHSRTVRGKAKGTYFKLTDTNTSSCLIEEKKKKDNKRN